MEHFRRANNLLRFGVLITKFTSLALQVEGLMTDIAAAEEEITRWKVAAEQEAAAGRAVEQEFVAQVC